MLLMLSPGSSSGVLTAWGTFRLIDPLLDSSRRLELGFLAGAGVIAAVTLFITVLEGAGTLDAEKITDFYKVAGTAIGAIAGCVVEIMLRFHSRPVG